MGFVVVGTNAVGIAVHASVVGASISAQQAILARLAVVTLVVAPDAARVVALAAAPVVASVAAPDVARVVALVVAQVVAQTVVRVTLVATLTVV